MKTKINAFGKVRKNFNKYYKEVICKLNEEEKFYMKFHKYRFFKLFLSLHALDAGGRGKILDIGTSHFTFIINSAFGEVSTINLTDLFKDECEQAGITFRKCDLTKDKIPFSNNYFDVVIFTEVFEHLVNPSKTLVEISRVLKKEGILIFGTPNVNSLCSKLQNLPLIKEKLENKIDPGHVKEYTMDECISALKENGFFIQEKQFANYWDKLNVRLSALSYRKILKFPQITIPFLLVFNFLCLAIPYLRGGIHIIAKRR